MLSKRLLGSKRRGDSSRCDAVLPSIVIVLPRLPKSWCCAVACTSKALPVGCPSQFSYRISDDCCSAGSPPLRQAFHTNSVAVYFYQFQTFLSCCAVVLMGQEPRCHLALCAGPLSVMDCTEIDIGHSMGEGKHHNLREGGGRARAVVKVNCCVHLHVCQISGCLAEPFERGRNVLPRCWAILIGLQWLLATGTRCV